MYYFSKKRYYKAVVSIIFGLFGFALNFLYFKFNFGNTSVNIYLGYIFPTAIALAWGVRYGLFSLIVGFSILSPFFTNSEIGSLNYAYIISILTWIYMQGNFSKKWGPYITQCWHLPINILIFILFYFTNPNNSITNIIVLIIISSINYVIYLSVFEVFVDFKSIRKILLLSNKLSNKSKLLTYYGIVAIYFFLFLLLEHIFYYYDFRITFFENLHHSLQFRIVIWLLFAILSANTAARVLKKYIDVECQVIQNDALFKKLFDTMQNSFCVVSLVYDEQNRLVDYKFHYINKALENIFGVSAEKIIGKTFSKLFQKQSNILNYLEIILLTGREQTFESSINNMCFVNTAFKLDDNTIGMMSYNITSVKAMTQKLEEANLSLEKKVLERTENLQSSVSELEKFTSTVSHDLKSPLRSVKAYCQIIFEDFSQTLHPQVKDYIDQINVTSTNMINLIDSILYYSTTTRAELKLELVPLQDLVNLIFNQFSSANPHRKFLLICSKSLPVVLCDKYLMMEVFTNLLGNAVKFTKNCKIAIITISYKISNREITISISDNGDGFDMKYADNLFTMFSRMHTTEEFEGHGIGLATVHSIIKKLGGRVWIEGKKQIGTTVYFTLPLTAN